MKRGLTHLDSEGKAAMVDVSEKLPQIREAVAEGFIKMLPETVALIRDGSMPKGDVAAVARIAGIQAAKRTPETIPLCHPLPLSKVSIDFEIQDTGVHITCRTKTVGQTGVEMEALTGVSGAALTLFDMCKAVDPRMEIGEIKVVSKIKKDTDA